LHECPLGAPRLRADATTLLRRRDIDAMFPVFATVR
jgi:hypothetical protein